MLSGWGAGNSSTQAAGVACSTAKSAIEYEIDSEEHELQLCLG